MVLEDHKRQGKVFAPPLTYKLGPLVEVSWVVTILPELVWLALLHDAHGDREAVRLITSLAKFARSATGDVRRRTFSTVSNYADLPEIVQRTLVHDLEASKDLKKIQDALFPLLVLYPWCPLRFLLSPMDAVREVTVGELTRLRQVVASLHFKHTRPATMVQATMTWLAFDADMLVADVSTSLAHFPEVEKYPSTDLSQRVAAGIRAGIFMFFEGALSQSTPAWPAYFWNRGLEVDDCYFDGASGD